MQGIDNMAAVIMAGGAGKRFWPLSTEARPKQFLTLTGERSLLQRSYDLVAGMVGPERILVLTNLEHTGLVAQQLPDLPPENIIGEPIRRDTAAAAALAAFVCRGRFGNPVIATLAADHLISPADRFRTTLASAVRAAAREEVLYTIGIAPTHPATGYGYLARGEMVFDDDGIRHYALEGFREKPDAATARRYLEGGTSYWNSGMFVWRTDVVIENLKRHLPNHAAVLGDAMSDLGTDHWEDTLAAAFEKLAPISIDYGLMEHAAGIRCVEADFSWSDVGGWNAVRDLLAADGASNSHRGTLKARDAAGNLVWCEDPRDTVMAIGVNDLVIVKVGGRLLVAHRDRVEEIKTLLDDPPAG